MSDKTTIQLSKGTKDEIDSLVDGKNYDVKLQKLIDGYESEAKSLDESDVKAIVDKRIEELKRELRR